MDKSHVYVIHSLTLIVSFVILIIYASVIRIHCKAQFLRQNFFRVLFYLSIFEFLLHLCYFITSLVFLIYANTSDSSKNLGYDMFPTSLIFSVIFTILSTLVMSVNSMIILYLFAHNTNSDSLMQQELANDSSSSRVSIHLMTHKYPQIYIVSFIIAIIHGGSLVVLYILNKDGNHNNVYFYILFYLNPEAIKSHRLLFLFFLPHALYFIISVAYFIGALDKNKISDKILLRSLSFYTFIDSILMLIFPVSIILYLFSIKDIIIHYINFVFIVLGIILRSRFRISRDYMDSILKDGNVNGGCLTKMISICMHLVTNKKIVGFECVDYNSAFIEQSLATPSDFPAPNQHDLLDASTDSAFAEMIPDDNN